MAEPFPQPLLMLRLLRPVGGQWLLRPVGWPEVVETSLVARGCRDLSVDQRWLSPVGWPWVVETCRVARVG